MTIGIVTDSTCDIPPATAAELGITVVPAYINIGSKSYLDGIELSRADFYSGLPTYESQPTTAAPAPGTFAETYERLASEGVNEILSIHVAASLSGMLNAASVGAQSSLGPAVTLYDSQQVTMGLGLLAMAAARAARAGSSMQELVQILDGLRGRTYVLAVLDTLEYLRRSGRVSWAEFGLGTLLRIKPLIRVHLGQVTIEEKVRTRTRAVERLLERVGEMAPLGALGLLHIRGEQVLEQFREQIRFLYPEGQTPSESEVTPAIGAHVGPGGLGVAFITGTST
jgi:DegV family protein with EDD domain